MSLPNLVPFQRRTHNAVSDPSGLAPWAEMHREMERLFDSFFNDGFTRAPLAATAATGLIAPSLDVAETEKAYVITAELPGLEDKDIDLTLSEGILTLRAEKTQEEESEGKTFHRIERRYGSVKRVLQLPGDADEGDINATMKNGVLSITVGKNKKAEPASRKIAIRKS